MIAPEKIADRYVRNDKNVTGIKAAAVQFSLISACLLNATQSSTLIALQVLPCTKNYWYIWVNKTTSISTLPHGFCLLPSIRQHSDVCLDGFL